MPSQTLHVIATITARPDTVEEVRAILLSLIEPTHQEDCCIAYQLLHNRSDPTDFILDEEWTSEAGLDAHLQTPHITAAIPKLEPLVTKLEIKRYDLLA